MAKMRTMGAHTTGSSHTPLALQHYLWILKRTHAPPYPPAPLHTTAYVFFQLVHLPPPPPAPPPHTHTCHLLPCVRLVLWWLG